MIRWLFRRTRWLRYLLVWPGVQAYRRRARRSLRWRLAGYNLLTLIAGLATALILVGALAAVSAGARDWAKEEPADDARAVTRLLVTAGYINGETPEGLAELEHLLDALVTHELPLYADPERDQFDIRPDRHLAGATAITVRGRAEQSWEARVSISEAHADFTDVIEAAYAGEQDLRRLSSVEGDRGVGAYPVAFEGEVWYVVVVDKHDIQAPQGWAILRAEIRPVVATVWVGSVVAAIPGLAVAALLAIAAARSVGGRVRDVSTAADAIAEGSLASRVPVRGEDEVASLSRSFNVMAERLQQTMASLEDERQRALALLDANRQLVADVSHELRTPVALIRGQVEALHEEAPGNTRIEMALRETGRLEQLVTDLFQLASAEAGPAHIELTELNAGALVREAAGPLVEPAWRESQVSLVIETSDQPTPVQAEPERLTRVIQNLVRNAVRHTPEGGLVRIAVTRDAEGAQVTVSDTGSGISPDDLPRVFERFYRGDGSRTRETGGAGLGLAIAREFVEAMGGTIEVASVPTEGATFTIRLRRPSRSA